MRTYIAIDTETTGLDIHKDKPFLIGTIDNKGTYNFLKESDFKKLPEIVGDSIPIFHNAKFDILMLKNVGFDFSDREFHDTQLMAFNADSRKKFPSLDYLVNRYLKRERPFNEIVKLMIKLEKKTYQEIPEDIMYKYLYEDVSDTLRLFYFFLPLLKNRSYLADIRLLPTLLVMEQRGVQISTDKIHEAAEEVIMKINNLSKKLKESLGDINLNSWQQTKKAFKDRLNISLPSVQKISLLKVVHHTAIELIEYKKWNKLLSTYLMGFLKRKTNRNTIHTTYNQVIPVTGRLSSSNPNLQNIPKRDKEAANYIRKCIVRRDGFVNYGFDYSQIELKIFACTAQCKKMLSYFSEGINVHRETAKFIFSTQEPSNSQYYIAKQINFGIIYGMGPIRFAKELNGSAYPQGLIDDLISVDQTKEWYEIYHEIYPEISDYMNRCIKTIHNNGKIVDIFDRTYYLKPEESYKAANYTIQGPAATIHKEGLRRFYEWSRGFKNKINPILIIHDEVIVELIEDLEFLWDQIPHQLNDLKSLDLPIRVDINKYGENLSIKEEINV